MWWYEVMCKTPLSYCFILLTQTVQMVTPAPLVRYVSFSWIHNPFLKTHFFVGILLIFIWNSFYSCSAASPCKQVIVLIVVQWLEGMTTDLCKDFILCKSSKWPTKFRWKEESSKINIFISIYLFIVCWQRWPHSNRPRPRRPRT